jgi:hypothetical protein
VNDASGFSAVKEAADNSYSWLESSCISKLGVDGDGPWSKTLKSWPKLAEPCRLRRFATGLPKLAWSRFIIASLRLRGLDVDEVIGESLLPSPPNLDSIWLTGAFNSELNGIFEFLSKLLRSEGLVLVQFSCPVAELAEVIGCMFPESDAWLKARFMGLLGEVLVRDNARGGAVFERAEDRRASFEGGNGTRGDGVWGGLLEVPVIAGWDEERLGDIWQGDGAFADGLGDFETRLNFEGDRDRLCLSDLTADVKSPPWWGEEGERVRAPPPLFEYGMAVWNAIIASADWEKIWEIYSQGRFGDYLVLVIEKSPEETLLSLVESRRFRGTRRRYSNWGECCVMSKECCVRAIGDDASPRESNHWFVFLDSLLCNDTLAPRVEYGFVARQ